jgi:energy-coupling factor transporter ATP-binding protein EcfA2
MASNTIEVRDIGPVEEFTYTLESPGLHVLLGKQGSGKTTVLRTIELALDSKVDVKPTRRDGARRGVANIAGRVLKLMRTQTSTGEIGFDSMGDLSIVDLHTPKFKTPETRDKHRIATLARLCAIKASPGLFSGLMPDGESFDAVVPAESLATTDLVEMAGAVKRSIERRALVVEEQGRTHRANAKAQNDLADGVPVDGVEMDSDKLDAAYKAAVAAEGKIQGEREAALKARAAAAEAQQRIAEFEQQALTNPDDLEAEVLGAQELVRASQKEIAQLEQQLQDARHRLELNEAKAGSLMDALIASTRLHQSVTEWRKVVADAQAVQVPSEGELATAALVVQDANKAIAAGRAAREAIAARRRAMDHVAAAESAERHATALRDAARGTAGVLSDAIASLADCPLRVIYTEDGDPRLVLATDRSETEPFDQLSDGERWPVILQIAVAANRVIVIHQSAFGELAPSTRNQLDALAREHGAYIVTAQADDGELRAAPWGSIGQPG